MFETLKTLIQNTKPSVFITVYDDHVDASPDDAPMVYCSIQWVWQDSADNWARIEALGIINEADEQGKIDIETLCYDFSDCDGGYSHEMTNEETWELDDLMVEVASDYSPLFHPYDMEIL